MGKVVEYVAQWSDCEDSPVEPINSYVVQRIGDDDLILSFGFAPPPLSLGPLAANQAKDRAKEMAVPIRGVRRFLVKQELLEALAKEAYKNLGVES